jgi:tetratricopeptide (TPR) repeat protein
MLLGYSSASMGMLGRFDEAIILYEKGVGVASELKDLLALGLLDGCYGTMQVFKGDGKVAIEYLQKNVGFYEEVQTPGLMSVLYLNLGKAYCLSGDLEMARNCLNKGLQFHSVFGASFHLGQFHGLSSMISLGVGDLKNAQNYAEESLRISQKIHQRWGEGTAWILLGRILGKAVKSQVDKAEECMLQGIEILRKLKLKPLYAEGYHFLGVLYADTGRQDVALENLQKAEGMFREMGMDYWLAKTQKVLEGTQT